MSITDPDTASRRAELGDDPGTRGDTARLALAADECARCAHTGRTCPSCVQRRRYAWALVNEDGETLERAARIMGLSSERIQGLIEAEGHRRELGSFKCDAIPVELTRSAVEQAMARDPDLSVADLARWLEMAQADFERAFIGKSKSGRPKRRVNVSSASRLMLALGRAPNELPGC